MCEQLKNIVIKKWVGDPPSPTNNSMSYEQLNDVGLKLLDQSNAKKDDFLNLDPNEFNPSKETLNKELFLIIDNFSDCCGATLTLKKKFHDDDDRWLHRHIFNDICNSRLWSDKKYMLFPEYTKQGVLHYHMIMWDVYQLEVMRCIKWWRRKYGFVKPELKLNSPVNWIKYITKDYMKTGLWTISKIQ